MRTVEMWNIMCGCCGKPVSIKMFNARTKLIDRKESTFFCSSKCYARTRGTSYKIRDLRNFSGCDYTRPKTWNPHCAFCGEDMIDFLGTYESKIRSGRRFFFCSKDHADKSKKMMKAVGRNINNLPGEAITTCEICGKEFNHRPSKNGRKFCSRDCVYKSQHLRGMRGELKFQQPEVYEKVRKVQNKRNGNTYLENLVESELIKMDIDYEPQYQIKIYDKNNKYIKQYFLDFAILDLKIDIECDGEHWHESSEFKARDSERDRLLLERGWKIIRLPGNKIKKELDECVRDIYDIINN